MIRSRALRKRATLVLSGVRGRIFDRPAHRRLHRIDRREVAVHLAVEALARRRDPRLVGRRAVDDAGDAEVEQLDRPIIGQDRVGRLDVAMQHAAAMRRRQPPREVERDVEDLARRRRPFELVERLAAHVLRDQVGTPRDMRDAVDRDDVGVLQPRDRARLVEESRTRHRIFRRLHELQRDRPIEQEVMRQVDAAHGTATEKPYQPVLLELVGRRPLGLDHVTTTLPAP